MNTFLDDLSTEVGWRFTESISFAGTFTVVATDGPLTVYKVPVVFSNFPQLSMQQYPVSIGAYLFLRHLNISGNIPYSNRQSQWNWTPATSGNWVALASQTNNATVQFITQAPSSAAALTGALPGALKKIHMNLPSTVTVNSVTVLQDIQPGVSDDLATGALAANQIHDIDLAGYYDGEHGFIAFPSANSSNSIIDVKFNYTNSGAQANVAYKLYGQALMSDWVLMEITYIDNSGGVHQLGSYDSIVSQAKDFQLDRLTAATITDPGQGQVTLGTLQFQLLNSSLAYSFNNTFTVSLDASIAYLQQDAQ